MTERSGDIDGTHCTALYTVMYHVHSTVHCTALHCTALQCTVYTALQCTVHCTALHCTALQCTRYSDSTRKVSVGLQNTEINGMLAKIHHHFSQFYNLFKKSGYFGKWPKVAGSKFPACSVCRGGDKSVFTFPLPPLLPWPT